MSRTGKTGSGSEASKAPKREESAPNPSVEATPAAVRAHQNSAKKLIASGTMFVAVTVLVAVISMALGSDRGLYARERFKVWLSNLKGQCEDGSEHCAFWASQGECETNPAYMTRICVKSCNMCGTTAINEQPAQEASNIEKESKDAVGESITEVDYDEEIDYEEDEEDGDGGDDEEEEEYDEGDEDDYVDSPEDDEDDESSDAPRSFSDKEIARREAANNDPSCVDSHPECPEWAKSGECDQTPHWMLANCRKSCRSCHEYPPKTPDENGCEDTHPHCKFWADHGECEKNPNWMLVNCGLSCKTCEEGANGDSGDDCVDNESQCASWASAGECEANPNYMLHNCRKSCKTCEPKQAASGNCKNRRSDKDCNVRAKNGECEKNPGWMIVMCGKSCNKCDLQLQKHRCLPEVFDDENYVYENALKKPGDLEKTFLRIIEEYPKTEVLLKPPKGPWIIHLPDFVSVLERDTLLNLTLPHVKRSTDQGAFDEMGVQEQVVSEYRTSSNAWCFPECEGHPVVANLTSRIASILRIDQKNFESYQVLEYKLGQKYDVHHDSSEDDIDDMAGPRILTFFMYFSDVEEGGETFFDKLGIKVKPRAGSAILWPSVLDEKPNMIDLRTTHAALPVIKGTKYAANLWVHMRDFKTPNLWGCTGSFD